MNKREAIFQPIFGDTWAKLPPVMQKHYANRPFTNDLVVVKGLMEVKIHWLVKLFAPIFSITKTLVPKAGVDVEVTVNFRSAVDSTHFQFDRIFTFPDGKTYNFLSNMEPIGGNEIVEWTASGLGWRAAFSYKNDRVILRHCGYCIKAFGKRIGLPLSALFGSANAEEWVISDNEFGMFMSIKHPIFGELYSYGGTFEITEMSLADEGQP